MRIIGINIFDRRTIDFKGKHKLSVYEFFGIITITLFGFTIDWFQEYGEWFIYLKTANNKFIRFSSAGFMSSWRMKNEKT